MNRTAQFFSLPLAAALCALPALAQQAAIMGTVTNKTTGKPSAGDTVTLIQLANGMQESVKTTTDARGRFTLTLPDSGMHLVRVTHDKVPYFQPAPPGTSTVNVDVYNGAAQVVGVRGEADVLRVEAQNNEAHLTELWAVENESTPPTTQFSAKAFEFWLPPNAEILSGAALGPNGMPVQQKPVPLGEPGHYAFVFPVRPGETRFQLSYKVPYTGRLDFSPKLSLPFNNVAVMLPKSMKFTGTPAFQPVTDQVDAQVFLAKGVTPQQSLAFTVSGTGTMPPETQQQSGDNTDGSQPGATTSSTSSMPTTQNGRPGGGLGEPEGTAAPLDKYKWWLLGSIALIFAGGLWFAMRQKSPAPIQPAQFAEDALLPASPHANTPAAPPRGATLEVLKDELFQLETARIEGRISENRYAELKSALETVLRHALERGASPAAPPRV